MLGIALFGAVCAITVTFLASRIAAGVSRNLRLAVFSKVENFSSAEFNQFSTGTLITRTTNDVQQIQQVLVMFMRIVVYAPIIGVGAIIKVLNTNASMTWIIALVVVVIMAIMGVAFAVVMPKFSIIQKLLDKMNSVLREFLDGLPVIRAFNTQGYEEKKFDQVNTDVTKTNLFVNRTLALLMPMMMLVMNCVGILIVWVGGHQINLGTLQVGDMMAFIQYSMQIIMAFLMITMVSIMLPRAVVSIKRVLEVLNCPLSIADPQQPKSFDPQQHGYVEFKDVAFRYPGAEENVLENISFLARPGQTTAFIGSTGSGKSTIVNLVPRFFDVTAGSIEVDGVDIREVSQQELRHKIGYVPQKGVLFSGTIESNLRYADADADWHQLEQAAEIAQASEFINAKPEGYDAPIAQGGTNVSGGQKQRLSIARALVRNPEIYIFDDSFSALDFKTDAALREALNELCQRTGSTVLLVAQRISSIMHADQIVVLDQGRIAGIGTHEQLMKTCEVYQEIAIRSCQRRNWAMTQNNEDAAPMGGHGMRGTGEKARDFGGTMKQLMKTLRPYSVMMFFGILFAAAATALTVLGPRVLGKATTALAEGFLAKAIGTGSIDFDRIACILIFLLCLYCVSALFHYFQNWLMSGVAQKVSYNLRRALAEKIDRLPFLILIRTPWRCAVAGDQRRRHGVADAEPVSGNIITGACPAVRLHDCDVVHQLGNDADGLLCSAAFSDPGHADRQAFAAVLRPSAGSFGRGQRPY